MKNLFHTFLKPPESVMVSLATAALVVAAYQYTLPSVAEVHASDAHDSNINASRKKAMFTSVGVAAGMFLLTHDVNTFTVGGLAFLAMEWSYRHANATHPGTGKLVPFSAVDSLQMGYQMPDAAPTGYEYTTGSYGM